MTCKICGYEGKLKYRTYMVECPSCTYIYQLKNMDRVNSPSNWEWLKDNHNRKIARIYYEALDKEPKSGIKGFCEVCGKQLFPYGTDSRNIAYQWCYRHNICVECFCEPERPYVNAVGNYVEDEEDDKFLPEYWETLTPEIEKELQFEMDK